MNNKTFSLVSFIFATLVVFNLNAQDTRRLRIMTYNLRFGEHATCEQLAEHIKAFNPDFVALQEVDVNTSRKIAPHQNGKNIIAELGGKTNMFPIYGKTINLGNGYYGIGILSKYPHIKVNKEFLPDPKNTEARVVLDGLFEINKGDTIIFASTHFDWKDESTRELQAKHINKYFADASYPIILGGDFNALPDSPTISKIMNKTWFEVTSKEPTFPAWEPSKKIDYIFVRPIKGWKIINSQAILSNLSDHLPVITEIQYIR